MSADNPNTSDTPNPDDSSGGPKVVPLGNGYSLVQWTVDDGYGNLKTQSQIVPDKDAASVAASAGVTAAGISAGAANQRAAVQAEIDRAKNASDAAHQAALDALGQGNAAEAKRQFDISQAELVRSHDLDYQSKQQDQALAGQKFAFDVYNKNADLASNPRNYMEQFFRMRGSEPPPGSASYGNNIVPFEQFAPKLLGSLGLLAGGPSQGSMPSSSGQGTAASVSAANVPVTGAMPMGGYGQPIKASAPMTRVSFDNNFKPTGSTTDMPGGAPGQVFRGVGNAGPQFGIAFNDHADAPIVGAPAYGNAVGPSGSYYGPNDVNKPKAPPPDDTSYARGGVIPEPVVGRGVMSGRPYQFGEKGPEGVVPANMLPDFLKRRAGQTVGTKRAYAKGGIIGDDIQQPGGGDPFAPPPVPTDTGGIAPDPGFISPPPQYGPAPGVGSGPLPSTGPFAPLVPSTPTLGTPSLTAPSTPLPAPLLPPAAPAPTPTPVTTAPPPLPTPSPTPSPIETRTPFNIGVPSTPAPSSAPAPSVQPSVEVGAPFVPPPLPSPFTPPTAPPNPAVSFSAQTPSFLSQLKSLSQTPSGLGKNPTFLPENSQNPIVNTLIQNGAFPPFLQRLYAQQAGLAGLGTNVPQQTNLPAGVPLASRLSLSQMNPSELAAFQSFISANGLDWNDYLLMVDAASPQGGTQRLTTSLPKFLSQ